MMKKTWNWIEGNWIHETAIIGDNVHMGKGNVIGPYSVIGETGFIRGVHRVTFPTCKVILGNNNEIGSYVSIMVGNEKNTILGDNNLIMNYVNVGHEVEIGSNNEIGPKSVICGHAHLGNQIQIKASSTIRNRIKIESNSIIGMGSNVTKSVQQGQTVYGNPASIRSYNYQFTP